MYNIDRLAKNVYKADHSTNKNQYATIYKDLDTGITEVSIYSTDSTEPVYESKDTWDTQIKRLLQRGFNVTEESPRYWGGSREGSGRPSTGRKKRNFYITDDEYIKITEYINQLREPSK